jgi:hypothetical protein
MTRPSAPKYAPFYDLFKLIVAVILTIILILLLLRGRQGGPVTPGISSTATLGSTARPLPTATLRLTSPPLPTVPSQTPLPTPTPGLTPVPTESIPTSDPNACPSSPTRIQVGDRVRVLSWLNFRTGPGRHWTIIQTNISGTVMEAVGGPVCTIRNTAEGTKAYLWWKVRMDNGQEGWSAEAPLIDPIYFLEPVR